MTEEETITRRKAKITKLLKLYKLQYRRLQDILRTRHELYVKRTEKFKERASHKHESADKDLRQLELLKLSLPRDTKEDEARRDTDSVVSQESSSAAALKQLDTPMDVAKEDETTPEAPGLPPKSEIQAPVLPIEKDPKDAQGADLEAQTDRGREQEQVFFGTCVPAIPPPPNTQT